MSGGAEMVFKRLYLKSTLSGKNAKYFTRNTLIAPHTGSGSTFVEGLGGVSPAVGEDPSTIFRHSFIVSRAFFQAFPSWVNHSSEPGLLYTLNSFLGKVQAIFDTYNLTNHSFKIFRLISSQI